MGFTPITLDDWITSSGSYPDRALSPELTDVIRARATELLFRVNSLLIDIGWEKLVRVSSGFRPTSVNSKIANAAKKSAHMTGMAIDLIDDKEQTLGKLIASQPALLRHYGLFLEALTATRGKYTNWVHLDVVQRSDRPSRTFLP